MPSTSTSGRIRELELKRNLAERAQQLQEPRYRGARSTLVNWTEAVAAGQIEGILKLYAPDAVLVPTLSNEIVFSEDDRRRYFEFFLSDGVPSCEIKRYEVRIDQQNSTVLIGGIYCFVFPRKSGEEKVPARFLFTFEEFGTRWLITGHHSSRCV